MVGPTGTNGGPAKKSCGSPRRGTHSRDRRKHASLPETPDVFPTNFAASPIVSAIQRLPERIELIGIATGRKRHDLTTEFFKPACSSWQSYRSCIDPSRLSVHAHNFLAFVINI